MVRIRMMMIMIMKAFDTPLQTQLFLFIRIGRCDITSGICVHAYSYVCIYICMYVRMYACTCMCMEKIREK